MRKLLEFRSAMVGAVVATIESAAPSGWLLLNGDTMGSASSGATKAHAQYEALYRKLWANLSDAVAPVTGGRGANAGADWAANKPIKLPDLRGRAIIAVGTGTVTESISGTFAGNAITVAENAAKWITGMQVTVSGETGFTGIGDGTCWVIRHSSTALKFATSLANAQNGTAATITGTGSMVITHTYAARGLGEQGGEESHAQGYDEMPLHTHSNSAGGAGTIVASPGGGAGNVLPTAGGTGWAGSASLNNSGGNVAHNNMQPFLALNYIIHF